MTIVQNDLRAAAGRAPLHKGLAASHGQKTAFLCHSHKDRVLAEGLQVWLREQGMDLYIDWQDATMPERPSKETGDRLRHRIVQTDWFLFLATANSMSSRWCPWELGYADGKKHIDRIVVIPTQDGSTTHLISDDLKPGSRAELLAP